MCVCVCVCVCVLGGGGGGAKLSMKKLLSCFGVQTAVERLPGQGIDNLNKITALLTAYSEMVRVKNKDTVLAERRSRRVGL